MREFGRICAKMQESDFTICLVHSGYLADATATTELLKGLVLRFARLRVHFACASPVACKAACANGAADENSLAKHQMNDGISAGTG